MPQATIQMTDLARALRDVVRQIRSSHPTDDRDRAAAGLLGLLLELGPVRASTLAEHAGLDQSTVSRHLKELENAGYLQRLPDPQDKRATVLEITDSGKALVTATIGQKVLLLESAVSNWSSRDVEDLTTLLRRLADELALS
jgi:DNA-binding MarR family transcriptional regulator